MGKLGWKHERLMEEALYQHLVREACIAWAKWAMMDLSYLVSYRALMC